MRFFNTAAPIKPEIHYNLPQLERLNKDEILALIAQEKYFILHAPRQTGKTTCLLALVEELNRTGQYRAVYANIEPAQALREQVERAMRTILSQISDSATQYLDDPLPARRMADLLTERGEDAFSALLKEWSQASPLPLVLTLDEVDALVGDTLISLLRQLRAGYVARPHSFPQSVILCGVRDVRDYRIHSSRTQEIITGSSAFNIKAESLRLGNFTSDEIKRLYDQHTAEIGQIFTPDVFPLAWDLTGGQPWLVNALAYEACWGMKENRDRTRLITAETFQQAKENLILRCDTHLDQLADKLQEDRLRRVIEPILAGAHLDAQKLGDDIQYVIDLGLITAFQQFFREHSEHWVERFDYKEAGPQLLLQAFLQRIVNGGGRIEREYGLGRKRTDLLIIWNYPGGTQRVVLELKIARGELEKVVQAGLEQTVAYMDRSGAREGHLVTFDRRAGRTWEERIYHSVETRQSHTIGVWGM